MCLLFNILAILGTAMYAGVLLAIGVILGNYWKSLPPFEFLNSFGDISQFIPKAIFVVSIITLIGLTGSIWLSWGEKDVRTLWLLATACIVLLLAFTIVWFAPTNAQFVAKLLPLSQVPAKLHTWLMLHNLRIALAALASILGVIATSR